MKTLLVPASALLALPSSAALGIIGIETCACPDASPRGAVGTALSSSLSTSSRFSR